SGVWAVIQRRAVAFAEVLPRTTRAWVVAANSRRGGLLGCWFLGRWLRSRASGGLGFFGAGGITDVLRDRLLEICQMALGSLFFHGLDLFFFGLDFKQFGEHVGRHARHHVEEEIEAFLLVFLLGVTLTVPAQMDAIPEVFHAAEVIDPL